MILDQKKLAQRKDSLQPRLRARFGLFSVCNCVTSRYFRRKRARTVTRTFIVGFDEPRSTNWERHRASDHEQIAASDREKAGASGRQKTDTTAHERAGANDHQRAGANVCGRTGATNRNTS